MNWIISVVHSYIALYPVRTFSNNLWPKALLFEWTPLNFEWIIFNWFLKNHGECKIKKYLFLAVTGPPILKITRSPGLFIFNFFINEPQYQFLALHECINTIELRSNFQMENFQKRQLLMNFENNIFKNKAGIWLPVIVTQLFQNFIVKNAPQFLKLL